MPEWEQPYGAGGTDQGYSIIQTVDGGYAIGGTTTSGNGAFDYYLVKIDNMGNAEWYQSGYGGGGYDHCNSVLQTIDGGYSLAGKLDGNHYDFHLIKTNGSGSQLWANSYHRTWSEAAYDHIVTSDGGYLLTGFGNIPNQDIWTIWVVKTDESGNVIWTRDFGTAENSDYGYSVVEVENNHYLIAGWTESYGAGGSDMYLIKIDSNGNEIWSRTYGGVSDERCYTVLQTQDGGILLCGSTMSYGEGDQDIYLVKTDASGNELWSQTYGGNGIDFCRSAVETSDGGIALAGCTTSFGNGDYDFWLIRLGDESHEIDIVLTAQSPLDVPRGGSFEYDALLTSNLADLSYVDIWTEAVLPDGGYYGPIWRIDNFPMGSNTIIDAQAIVQAIPLMAPIGSYTFRMKAGVFPLATYGYDELSLNVIPAVAAEGQATGWDAEGYETAFNVEPESVIASAGLLNQYELSSAYPNPFNPSTTVKVTLAEVSDLTVRVVNIAGQQVAELADGRYAAGKVTMTFDASNLSSGVYFIHATVPGHMNEVQKVMLVR